MIREDRPMIIVDFCLCLECHGRSVISTMLLQPWRQKVGSGIKIGQVNQPCIDNQLIVVIYIILLFFFRLLNIWFGLHEKVALCKSRSDIVSVNFFKILGKREKIVLFFFLLKKDFLEKIGGLCN